MKVVKLHKISEWSLNQWEGDLEDGHCVYARIKHDRLSVGIGSSYANALCSSVTHPWIDIFLRRDDWDAGFPTSELVRHLKLAGFNCSLVDSDEVESKYSSHLANHLTKTRNYPKH